MSMCKRRVFFILPFFFFGVESSSELAKMTRKKERKSYLVAEECQPDPSHINATSLDLALEPCHDRVVGV